LGIDLCVINGVLLAQRRMRAKPYQNSIGGRRESETVVFLIGAENERNKADLGVLGTLWTNP